MPTEEHKKALDDKIEQDINDFNTTLSTFVADEFTPFVVDEDTNLMTCFDNAVAAFAASYDDQTPIPAAGVYNELVASYTECTNEMDEF